jgi:hypothetical protein
MTTPRKTALPTEPTITPENLTRAAVNLPADQFVLGDRTFYIKDLPYDSYIAFISYLTPLVEAVVSRMMGNSGVSIPGIELQSNAFSASKVLSLCGKELPEMVRLICAQTEPSITIEEIKQLAKKPTVLVAVVLKQIDQNGIIKDFADFFVQVVAVMKPLTPAHRQTT